VTALTRSLPEHHVPIPGDYLTSESGVFKNSDIEVRVQLGSSQPALARTLDGEKEQVEAGNGPVPKLVP
jgi:hypothetical protein